MNRNTDTRLHVTRRAVLEAGTAAAAFSFIGLQELALGAGLPDAEAPPVTVGLQINGRPHALMVDVRTTLLNALRERLAMTATKK